MPSNFYDRGIMISLAAAGAIIAYMFSIQFEPEKPAKAATDTQTAACVASCSTYECKLDCLKK
jgi:hypothetical protein